MYLRYTIFACVLLCCLFVMRSCSCRTGGDVTPKTPALKAGDPDAYYEQLVRKRMEFQEKIFEAMDAYRSTSQKVHEQNAKLKQYLGGNPATQTIELFISKKNRPSEVPPDLRIAFSCWQTLLPDEKQRLQIASWVEKLQVSGILETLDTQIKEIENRRQLGKFLDKKELAEIDRLIAQQVVDWKTEPVSDAVLEAEAIKSLKVMLFGE